MRHIATSLIQNIKRIEIKSIVAGFVSMFFAALFSVVAGFAFTKYASNLISEGSSAYPLVLLSALLLAFVLCFGLTGFSIARHSSSENAYLNCTFFGIMLCFTELAIFVMTESSGDIMTVISGVISSIAIGAGTIFCLLLGAAIRRQKRANSS